MIFASAIKQNGLIFIGKRHSDCMRVIYDITHEDPDRNSIQGFIDEKGNFYNRYEAAKIAKECGQLKDGKEVERLLSEDLW